MSDTIIRPMTDKEKKKAAKEFVEKWRGQGYEKGQSQPFWIQLLRNVFGVEDSEQYIIFENEAKIDNKSAFMDGRIKATSVLIEQKSIDKDLRKAIKQSDGTFLTPYQQALRYIMGLPKDEHPSWIITCNFKSFLIYDMNKVNGEPEEILLEDLPKEYYRLEFLVEKENTRINKETKVSVKAGELIGEIYDELLKQYDKDDIENGDALKSLNKLCVRLVFCLYAEDAEIFGIKDMFYNYIRKYDATNLRKALRDLFNTLNTKIEDRDKYLEDDLAQFPYVNGGLFAEEIDIPQLTDEIRSNILDKASADFDWSLISPTIFGAVFESTLNPETRRSGGMHYTSIENIHKVIDQLFLDDLKKELEEISELKQPKVIRTRVDEFQNKLASLKFLDPACGSGNFLTESYMSLRKLENEAIALKNGMQIELGSDDEETNPIKVGINQFYGIEINDFAVTVATTALWIAEAQMLEETQKIIHHDIDFLPLKSYTNILEANALRVDWNDVLPKEECNYIMGNPPFIGASNMTKEQKNELFNVFENIPKCGDLDYVTCWYKLASDYIKGTQIECAFVSTNSICQGEQPSILWRNLFKNGVIINFAHKTFKWDSEASLAAHVHVIIVGFSRKNRINKILYDSLGAKVVNNINGYLIDADNIFIDSFSKPLSNVAKMIRGSSPCDNGNYSFDEDEMKKFIKRNPNLTKYIKKYIGSKEFINNIPRYCIWLENALPGEYRNNSDIRQLMNNVSDFRLLSKKEQTRELAKTPLKWEANRYNNAPFILIPRVSSEKRKYVPIGFMDGDTIANDSVQLVPNASLYDFGILTSNVHNAWMRVVAGRLEMRYRYSNLVYNSFIWPNANEAQKQKIEKTAQMILDARALYSNSSLADLYDELTMPPELRKAHQENDKAVMEAYGFDWHKMTESDCVAKLMEMYQDLVNK